jgi:crossover junction endodeoxyribonuclease RuvC
VPGHVRIIGIDPGLSRCGYAVIDYDGRKPETVEFGLIRTSAKDPATKRLSEIIEELGRVIDEYEPAECAVERVYFHRNVSTAIDVAMVMGAALVLAVKKGLEAKQFQKMVTALYQLDEIPKPPDVADALAVALTHAHLRNAPEEASVG